MKCNMRVVRFVLGSVIHRPSYTVKRKVQLAPPAVCPATEIQPLLRDGADFHRLPFFAGLCRAVLFHPDNKHPDNRHLPIGIYI